MFLMMYLPRLDICGSKWDEAIIKKLSINYLRKTMPALNSFQGCPTGLEIEIWALSTWHQKSLKLKLTGFMNSQIIHRGRC